MELLARISFEEAKKISGKLIVEPTEEGGKPIPVKLNIACSSIEAQEAYKMIGGNVKCITIMDNGVPNFGDVEKLDNVFHFMEFIEFDSFGSYEMIPGVVTLVYVGSDYTDMRYLAKLCSEHPDVRFFSGSKNGCPLMAVEGIRIGRYDDGKGKMSPVFQDVYDRFMEVDYSELSNITEVVRKASKKLEGSEEKKPRKAKSPSEKSVGSKKSNLCNTINALFGESTEEDF